MEPNPHLLVADLLKFLFSPDELRLFLRKYTDADIAGSLPTGTVSANELCYSAVETLKRHAYISPRYPHAASFFKNLLGVRPDREAEIRKVCNDLGIQIEGPVPRLHLRHVDASANQAVRRAFISYSRDDADWASATAMALGHADIEVFMDTQSIGGGADFQARIVEIIDRVDRVILGWSASAASSKWVREEYLQALRVREEELVERFLVIELLDDTPLPPELQALNARKSLFRVAMSYDVRLSGLAKDDRLAIMRILDRLPTG